MKHILHYLCVTLFLASTPNAEASSCFEETCKLTMKGLSSGACWLIDWLSGSETKEGIQFKLTPDTNDYSTWGQGLRENQRRRRDEDNLNIIIYTYRNINGLHIYFDQALGITEPHGLYVFGIPMSRIEEAWNDYNLLERIYRKTHTTQGRATHPIAQTQRELDTYIARHYGKAPTGHAHEHID